MRSVEFTGASPVGVPLDQYRAAAPDPLWREAAGVLRHLEQGHMVRTRPSPRAGQHLVCAAH